MGDKAVKVSKAFSFEVNILANFMTRCTDLDMKPAHVLTELMEKWTQESYNDSGPNMTIIESKRRQLNNINKVYKEKLIKYQAGEYASEHILKSILIDKKKLEKEIKELEQN